MLQSTKRSRSTDNVQTGNSLSVLSFYDDILGKILENLSLKKPTDRNAISAVCKRFHELEAKTRHHVLVYNMYAVKPMDLFVRFPSVRSITIKGNNRLVDFNIMPREWAGHAGPWIDAIKVYPQLNRLRIKRMMITDSQIEDLCAACGGNLKILILDKCTGFTSNGLESLSKYCRNLTTLGLAQSMSDSFMTNTRWLKLLADTCLSLEVLDLSLIEIGEVDDQVLVKLAKRCKILKLWESQDLEKFQPILDNCTPELTDLGIERISSLSSGASSLAKCTSLEGLSGIFDLVEGGKEAFLSVSSRLKRLDLSYSTLSDTEIAEVLSSCPALQQLRVLDSCADVGLQALGRSCKELRRLVVESPSDNDGGVVTHIGLMAVARGCRNLQKLIFYASGMTDEALKILASNCPGLVDVRICLVSADIPDSFTNLDEGVGDLVKKCQGLYRLTLSFGVKTEINLLTDRGAEYVGRFGKKLRMLSLVNCGTSDTGLCAILHGCVKLQRLEIRKCPIGDESMAAIATAKQLHLKYLFMQGCHVSESGLQLLALRAMETNSKFYVEVIGCRDQRCIDEHRIGCTETPGYCAEHHHYSLSCSHYQILAYHSLAEPRNDLPPFITRFEPSLFVGADVTNMGGGVDTEQDEAGGDEETPSLFPPLRLDDDDDDDDDDSRKWLLDLNEPPTNVADGDGDVERDESFSGGSFAFSKLRVPSATSLLLQECKDFHKGIALP